MFFGGNIWESNPSGTGLAPHTGFEDQEAHRHLSAPSESIAEIGSFVNLKLLFTGNVPQGAFCEQSSQKTRELRSEIMLCMISVHREARYCERSEQ